MFDARVVTRLGGIEDEILAPFDDVARRFKVFARNESRKSHLIIIIFFLYSWCRFRFLRHNRRRGWW